MTPLQIHEVTEEAAALIKENAPPEPKRELSPAEVAQRRDAAVKHGSYRARTGISRADRLRINRTEKAIVEMLPWAQASDAVAVRELAKLLLRAERVDGHLSRVGDLTDGDDAKRLLGERRHLSSEIRAWCRELGLTPAARAALGVNVARGRVLDIAAAMSEEGDDD